MADGARLLPIVARGLGLALDGRSVLDGASFAIASAGITAVIGPNGAGKSTLLRVLDGLLAPDRGDIAFGTRPADAIRRAFVFQKTALVRASVAYNVGLGLLPMRLDAPSSRRRIAGALARVGLGDRAGDPARRLSGGEQQRIALARAWAIEPELLLLDEPTASLDPAASEVVERLIAEIAASGTKVILVSHNLGQVARLAEDVIVFSAGAVAEHGPTTQVMQRPASAAARSYLQAEIPWLSFAAGS